MCVSRFHDVNKALHTMVCGQTGHHKFPASLMVVSHSDGVFAQVMSVLSSLLFSLVNHVCSLVVPCSV